MRSELWRQPLDGRHETLLLDDMVVLAQGMDIGARDAFTGRTLWTFDVSSLADYEPSEQPSGNGIDLARTGDVVVAGAYGRRTDGTRPHVSLLGLDSRTGALLWSLASGIHLPYFSHLATGGGQVLIHIPALGVVRALDATRGTRRWDARLPPGCRLEDDGAADNRVLALLMACGDRSRLHILAVSTGRLLWERMVSPLGPAGVEVQHGVIGVESANALSVYDIDGRQLYDRVAEGICDCGFAVTADDVLISRVDDAVFWRVSEMIDRRSGRVRQVSGGPDESFQVLAAGERLYLKREFIHGLRGTLIETVDPVTGIVTPVVALPYTSVVIGVNQRLILADEYELEGSGLTAYRIAAPPLAEPGIVARGGVDRSRWPDACALIPRQTLRSEFPDTRYTLIPRPAPPELALSTPVGCDLVPTASRGDASTISVSVLWVGLTSEEAGGLIAIETSGCFGRRVRSPAPADDMSTCPDLVDAVLIRVGNAVVRMDGAGDSDRAVRLARSAARTLRSMP